MPNSQAKLMRKDVDHQVIRTKIDMTRKSVKQALYALSHLLQSKNGMFSIIPTPKKESTSKIEIELMPNVEQFVKFKIPAESFSPVVLLI